jgi:hypothetical protein
MSTLRTVTLVIHISAAAMLIGANTGVVRNLTNTLELSREAFLIAVRDAAKRGAILGICSLLTLATGLALIFMMGGMAVAPLNYHMALGLMLGAIVVSSVLMRPSGAKLMEVAQAETLDKARAASLIKKLAMGQGILHLMWLVTLTLMLVPIYK